MAINSRLRRLRARRAALEREAKNRRGSSTPKERPPVKKEPIKQPPQGGPKKRPPVKKEPIKTPPTGGPKKRPPVKKEPIKTPPTGGPKKVPPVKKEPVKQPPKGGPKKRPPVKKEPIKQPPVNQPDTRVATVEMPIRAEVPKKVLDRGTVGPVAPRPRPTPGNSNVFREAMQQIKQQPTKPPTGLTTAGGQGILQNLPTGESGPTKPVQGGGVPAATGLDLARGGTFAEITTPSTPEPERTRQGTQGSRGRGRGPIAEPVMTTTAQQTPEDRGVAGGPSGVGVGGGAASRESLRAIAAGGPEAMAMAAAGGVEAQQRSSPASAQAAQAMSAQNFDMSRLTEDQRRMIEEAQAAGAAVTGGGQTQAGGRGRGRGRGEDDPSDNQDTGDDPSDNQDTDSDPEVEPPVEPSDVEFQELPETTDKGFYRPTQAEAPTIEVAKTGQTEFDPEAMLNQAKQLKAFQEGSATADYDPETGMYNVSALA